MIIQKGNILIDRKTLKSYPIMDVINGHAYLELGNRLAKRSLRQIIRHSKKFIHLKVGQRLEADYDDKINVIIREALKQIE